MNGPSDSRKGALAGAPSDKSSQENSGRSQDTIEDRRFAKGPNGRLYRRGSIKFARAAACDAFRQFIAPSNEPGRSPDEVANELARMAREQAERFSRRRAESLEHLALELKADHVASAAGTVAAGGGL